MLLSKEEAIDFLTNTLRINEIERKIITGKLELLKEITNTLPKCIPFQNLSLLATKHNDRCFPPSPKIRQDFLSLVGGLCYSSAVFAHGLLTALGFTSHLVACSIPNTGGSFTHVAAVATNVTHPGDSFLIDLGAGFPTFDPVPLHSLPQQYHHAFLQYKYVKEEDDLIVRYHKVGQQLGNLPTAVDDEGWQKFYEFVNVPRDEDFLKMYQEPVYTVPGYASGWYLMGLKMTFYPTGRAISLNNYVLKLWDGESKEMKATKLENMKELENAIRMHFPMLHGIDVYQALTNWKQMEKTHKD